MILFGFLQEPTNNMSIAFTQNYSTPLENNRDREVTCDHHATSVAEGIKNNCARAFLLLGPDFIVGNHHYYAGVVWK